MKKILALLFLAGLGAGAASAQTSIEPGLPLQPGHSSPRSAPPVNSPEPLTIIALAGGAAVAGGLVRRRRKQQ